MKSPFLISCLSLLFCLPGTRTSAALPSSRIKHPAALFFASDRRLKRKPEENAKLVRQAMALTDRNIGEMILPLHGFHTPVACPKCGREGLSFNLQKPNQLTCPECGKELFADSLPIDTTLSGPNPLGETITYKCTTIKRNAVCLAGSIRYRRHQALAEAARALGEAYQQTGREDQAHRAVLILLRFAEVYPHWPVVEIQRPRSYLIRYTLGPQEPYDHWEFAKWTRLFMYEIPQDLVFAYDCCYEAKAWDALGSTPANNLREKVENQLFRPALAHSLKVHRQMGGHLSNLNPTLYQRMIHLARVLNDPDTIHLAIHFMQDMIRMSYHFDGMEYEGAMTYHGIVTGRLGIAARALAGYQDPPGYVDSVFGIKINATNHPLDFPIHRKAWKVWNKMKFPNGNPVCVHDTNWPKGRKEVPAGQKIPNIELNAYGHYAIGSGLGNQGMQAHLHFCPLLHGPHYHQDHLNLILWGAGEELLPDTGYVHVGKPRRYFINRAVAHNTVEVFFNKPPEKPEQKPLPSSTRDPVKRFKEKSMHERQLQDMRSRLLAYAPGVISGGRVKLVSASSPGPQWMGIKRRQRQLITVRIDENRSYLVDIFRVRGGNRHRFTLRGSADENVIESCSLSLAEVPGTLAGTKNTYGKPLKQAEPYSWVVHQLRQTQIDRPWQLTWTGAESAANLRIFAKGQADTTVTLAKSPTLRRARQDARRADDFQGPHLLLERKAENELESLFAIVYDCWPKTSKPAVRKVEWKTLGTGAEATLCATIHLEGRKDFLYASLDQRKRNVDGIEFSGLQALHSQSENGKIWSWAQGASIRSAEGEINAPMETHPLVAVKRRAEGAETDALVIAGKIVNPEELPGQWAIVKLEKEKAYGYRINAVTQEGENTRLDIFDEPGFQLKNNNWELLFNPFYEGKGPCQVQIIRGKYAEWKGK